MRTIQQLFHLVQK